MREENNREKSRVKMPSPRCQRRQPRGLVFAWLLALCSTVVLVWELGCSTREAAMSDPSHGAPEARRHYEIPPGTLAHAHFDAAEPEELEALRNLEIVNDQAYDAMYFQHFGVNPTIDTEEEAFSTFSVDVDTASYSVTRSYLQRGHLPPEDAIRVEEFINAFDYGYRAPDYEVFDLAAEAFPSPTRPGYHVLHLGLEGKQIQARHRKAANLVFVIDVSGSMNMENRLGLVKKSLRMLVGQMDSADTIGIVVYGSRARVVLEPISGAESERVLAAIDSLSPEGATNAQEGIELAYRMASRSFREGGINRVILCSDGVANMGQATGADSIFERVKEEANQGITISAIGFGMGNYNDVLMERLAQIGNGNYYYVDREREARRVFVENLTATLQVIARDVKIQVEFDRSTISRFRLLGYENRLLEREDFEDDNVDAGEIGAGHTVTALYEIKFKRDASDIGTLRVRYKDPEGGSSRLIEREIPSQILRGSFAEASPPTRLSFVVAAFAEKLRGSYWVRKLSYEDLENLYQELPRSLRSREQVEELEGLIASAARLDRRGDKFEGDLPVAGLEFDRVPILR